VAGSAVCGDWGEAAEGVARLGVRLGFRGRTCVYVQSTHIGPIWVAVGPSHLPRRVLIHNRLRK